MSTGSMVILSLLEMSSPFIDGHYAASRTPKSFEYLERFPSSAEGLSDQLTSDFKTHLLEAGALVKMYQDTGITKHVDLAAQIIHQVSSNMADDDPHLGYILNQPETAMDIRFVGTGELHGLKLDLAVEVAERAVLVTAPDHHCRAASLLAISVLGSAADSIGSATLPIYTKHFRKLSWRLRSLQLMSVPRPASGIIRSTSCFKNSISFEI